MKFLSNYSDDGVYSQNVQSYASELNPSDQFIDNESKQRFLDIIDLITHPAFLIYEKVNPLIWSDVSQQSERLNDRVATYQAAVTEIEQHVEDSASTSFTTWLSGLGVPKWVQTSLGILIACVVIYYIIKFGVSLTRNIATGGVL